MVVMGQDFDGSDLGTCINSGFRNTIVELNNSPWILARIGLISDSNRVISYRRENVSLIKDFISSINVSEINDPTTYRIITKLQEEKCLAMIHNRDIVPKKDLFHESKFQAIAKSSVQTIFTTSSTIHKIILPIPFNSSFSDAKISTVLEYVVRFNSSYSSYTESLSDTDLLYFLLGYFMDQYHFYEHFGYFHTDGHAGNILIGERFDGRKFFVWSDFGKTSTSSSWPNQLANSLSGVLETTRKHAQSDVVKSLVQDLIVYFFNDLDVSKLTWQSFRDVVDHIQGVISNQSPNTLTEVLNRVNPIYSLGYHALSQMIDQHTTTINTQRDMIESLQLENLELKSQISAQDTKIQSLQEIVLELQRMFKQQFGMVSDNGANDNGTLAVSLPRAEL